jgi:hypothetical protein
MPLIPVTVPGTQGRQPKHMLHGTCEITLSPPKSLQVMDGVATFNQALSYWGGQPVQCTYTSQAPNQLFPKASMRRRFSELAKCSPGCLTPWLGRPFLEDSSMPVLLCSSKSMESSSLQRCKQLQIAAHS